MLGNHGDDVVGADANEGIRRQDGDRLILARGLGQEWGQIDAEGQPGAGLDEVTAAFILNGNHHQAPSVLAASWIAALMRT